MAFLQGDSREASGDQIAAQTTPAEARAIGRSWRASGDPEVGVQYAQALLATSLNDELIAEIRAGKLLGDSPATAALFEAEALLRLRRFDDARAIASSDALKDNPFAAFIRVRTASADETSAASFDKELLAALRGPAEVAREAWLYRAQMALAANQFDAADAAGRRAREAGATAGRTEILAIETAIRRGDQAGAAALMKTRANRLEKSRSAGFVDYEGLRLATMIALRSGAADDAARYVDRGQLGAPGATSAPLAALAKWAGGDQAQAYAILRRHLAIAPADWIALDLAASLAAELGRADAAKEHLSTLERVRPGLAALRRAEKATRTDDLDAAFSLLASAPADAARDGAGEALLGPAWSAASTRISSFADPGVAARALAALIALGADAGPRTLRLAAEDSLALRKDALSLAAAARAYSLAGDPARAIALAEAAAAEAPSFAAPVMLAARLKAEDGRAAEAMASLTAFLVGHPGANEVRIALAEIAASAGDFAAAFEALKAASPSLAFATDETALLFAKAAQAIGGEANAYVARTAGFILSPSVRLGRIYEATGDIGLAAAAWRRALIAAPLDPELPALYLGAMSALGRADEAKALLGEIARRYPGSAAVAAALRG